MEPNVDLNNTIVHFRKAAGEAKSSVKEKLERRIGELREEREKLESEIKKSEKKMQKYSEQKRALKGLDLDEVSKFALGNKKSLRELKDTSKLPSDRMMFKVATDESMTSAVEEFREKNPQLRRKDLRRIGISEKKPVMEMKNGKIGEESKTVSAIFQEALTKKQDSFVEEMESSPKKEKSAKKRTREEELNGDDGPPKKKMAKVSQLKLEVKKESESASSTSPVSESIRRQLCSQFLQQAKSHGKKYTCGLCSKELVALTEKEVMQHAHSHMKMPIFRCKKCLTTGPTYLAMLYHLKSHHKAAMMGNYEDRSNQYHSKIMDTIKKIFGQGSGNDD